MTNNKNYRYQVFEKASLARNFEEQVIANVKNKKIKIPVYVSAGQEFIASTIATICKLKKIKPLITYDWFPKHAKFYLSNYDFPVFPEDFAYYLMKDDKTLIMLSAVKNINQSFKFDISTRKLKKYSTKGKLDFIISSITKDCGFSSMNDTFKCNYYKPLISQNLIN